ncbi:MAG: 23S rRNA (uracil(1939)-C(5))-methyltransferase RlmD [Candidatus Aenigmatarchaeota archaeon]
MICKHFGICGGCTFQNLDYKEEVKLKKQKLENYLDFVDISKKFIEAKSRFFYRNRMDFVINKENEKILIGLREKGRWFKVVNLEECLIFSEKTFEYLKSIKEFLEKNGLEAYDLINKTGNVRYAVIRESKNIKKIHVNFVVAKDFPAEKFLKEYNNLFTSVSVSINDTPSDVSYGKLKDYYGEIYSEKIYDLEFIISPNSFFQTNTKMAEVLLKEVEKFVEGKFLLDLYSGVGLFSLYFANKFEKVIGVEIEESSVEDAKKNAIFNSIRNVNFIKSRVEDVIRVLNGDFAIVDPPRAGLSKKVIKGLISNKNIKRLLYVSCNVKTLARDLKILKNEFEILDVIGFDFFPNTEHFEIVSFLSRK